MELVQSRMVLLPMDCGLRDHHLYPVPINDNTTQLDRVTPIVTDENSTCREWCGA
jgi:hypothetical protein